MLLVSADIGLRRSLRTGEDLQARWAVGYWKTCFATRTKLMALRGSEARRQHSVEGASSLKGVTARCGC